MSENTKSVRELGGEIWAQLRGVEGLDWRVLNLVTDEILGVLARHVGTTIVNDPDLPVQPSKYPPAEGC